MPNREAAEHLKKSYEDNKKSDKKKGGCGWCCGADAVQVKENAHKLQEVAQIVGEGTEATRSLIEAAGPYGTVANVGAAVTTLTTEAAAQAVDNAATTEIRKADDHPKVTWIADGVEVLFDGVWHKVVGPMTIMALNKAGMPLNVAQGTASYLTNRGETFTDHAITAGEDLAAHIIDETLGLRIRAHNKIRAAREGVSGEAATTLEKILHTPATIVQGLTRTVIASNDDEHGPLGGTNHPTDESPLKRTDTNTPKQIHGERREDSPNPQNPSAPPATPQASPSAARNLWHKVTSSMPRVDFALVGRALAAMEGHGFDDEDDPLSPRVDPVPQIVITSAVEISPSTKKLDLESEKKEISPEPTVDSPPPSKGTLARVTGLLRSVGRFMSPPEDGEVQNSANTPSDNDIPSSPVDGQTPGENHDHDTSPDLQSEQGHIKKNFDFEQMLEILEYKINQYIKEIEAEIAAKKQENAPPSLNESEREIAMATPLLHIVDYSSNITKAVDDTTGPRIEQKTNDSNDEVHNPFGDFSQYTKVVVIGGSEGLGNDWVHLDRALAW